MSIAIITPANYEKNLINLRAKNNAPPLRLPRGALTHVEIVSDGQDHISITFVLINI